MKRIGAWYGVAVVALVATAGVWVAARAGGLHCAAEDVANADARRSEVLIKTLRDAGPAGLEALLAGQAAVLKAGPQHPRWARVTAAVDAVAGQRDAASSRLYWYTDLEQAKAAARAQGKPILSLRLLGRLDEELSCANSRYFRTALYANHELSRELREKFILHWRSVRPAPRITIDYGDGRRVERTITGNSVHYVLDARGRVIDALPGLYGPQAFGRALERARVAAVAVADLKDAERRAFLRDYHDRAARSSGMAKAADESRLGEALLPASSESGFVTLSRAPDAIQAGRLAMTKAAVERPMLNPLVKREIPAAPIEPGWARAAAYHLADARLDDGSLALMRRKLAGTAAGRDEASFRSMVLAFERVMAEDGLRNEYVMHERLHEWLGAADVDDVEAFNERVYAEVFLTPRTDPWLGLVPSDAYAALEGQGLR